MHERLAPRLPEKRTRRSLSWRQFVDLRASSRQLPLAPDGLRPKPMGVRICIEDVDLAELTAALHSRFAGAPPTGYLDGRTAMRDAVAEKLDCSALAAEEIVDTLATHGFIRYEGSPTAALDDGRRWSFVVGTADSARAD
jgi:hypothetical protein